MLAVGLETGNILLFTSTDGVNWKMSLEIDAGYVAYDNLVELGSRVRILDWRI